MRQRVMRLRGEREQIRCRPAARGAGQKPVTILLGPFCPQLVVPSLSSVRYDPMIERGMPSSDYEIKRPKLAIPLLTSVLCDPMIVEGGP